MSKSGALKFGYVDDWAIACQSHSFKTIETNLTQDVNNLHDLLNKWYLKMNKTKTVSTVFHLDNHHAAQILKILIGNKQLPTEPNPKYFGVSLDRTLTYKKHTEKIGQKLKARNSILKKLTETTWRAHQTTLRTFALAFCYSTADFCAPVWKRSKHAKKIDIQLNTTMRKAKPTIWLPTKTAIAPPHLRRQKLTQNAYLQLENLPDNILIKKIIEAAPSTRLKS